MKNKKNEQIKSKSSVLFRVVLSMTVLLGFLFAWFFYRVLADKKNMPSEKSVAVVVMEADVD